MVHAAGENALARRFDQTFAVRGSESVCGPAHKRFDTADFCAAQRIEFGQLNDPDTLGLQHRILGAQVRQFISEVWPCQRFQRGGFLAALRTFQNETAVGLHAGSVDSCYSRNQPTCTNSSAVVRILRTQLSFKPSIQPVDAVPGGGLQKLAHGMEGSIFRNGLRGLCRRTDIHQNALLLQPFCSEPIFMVAPGVDIRNGSPRSGLHRHASQKEFVEGEHALAFGGMTQSRDGIGENRINVSLGMRRCWFCTNQFLPPIECSKSHARDFAEYCFRPDRGQVIVNAFAVGEIPFHKADHRALAPKVLRQLEARETNLVFYSGIGIESDDDFAAFPRDPI